jgi:hypothetical protein
MLTRQWPSSQESREKKRESTDAKQMADDHLHHEVTLPLPDKSARHSYATQERLTRDTSHKELADSDRTEGSRR